MNFISDRTGRNVKPYLDENLPDRRAERRIPVGYPVC